ncbi:glycosyltransferase family 39 protein [Clostridium felsineum]|uniref:Uncharacterized protein n=1 Tax=Clostridium felsineum TaxID=36839 RepID=A0A1S8L5P6_9CLOT|nr:glycosyltransferase family 39 protein [Clostridium felsineum]URZ04883.1 hypothetical protein CLROS_002070 [Clostridium felsineum]URZ09924.1 hypothetical protein CROST_006320 [Clostridium felsineum]
MEALKKNKPKFILSFIIAILVIICVYSLCTYKGNDKNTGFPKIGAGFKNHMTNSANSKNTPSSNSKKVTTNNIKKDSRTNSQNHSRADIGGPPDSQDSSGSKSTMQGPPGSQGSPNFKNNIKRSHGGPPGMMGGFSNSDNKYSPYVIAYALAFFVLSILGYLAIVKKKIKISTENSGFILASFLIIGFLFRIIVGLLITGYSSDIGLYKQWASSAAKNFASVYKSTGSIDYPPVYIYVLFIIGKIASTSLGSYYTLLIKLPSIIADIASAYFVYKLSKKYFSFEKSFVLTLFFLFNPAILINSALWGQADSFFTLLIIFAVYFMSENKIILSSVFFALSVLMKPQGIIFLPLVLFWYIRNRDLKAILKSIASGILTAIIVILPFSIVNGNITWIFKLYTREVSEYPYASNNAYNLYNLIGANNVKDSNTMFIFSYHTWGMIFIVLITVFSGILFLKSKSKRVATLAALIQVVGVFNLSVGMHERYMFAAVLISILAYIYFKNNKILIISLLLSFINYANMHSVLFNQMSMRNNSSTPIWTVFISLLNIITFAYLIKVSFDLCIKKNTTA